MKRMKYIISILLFTILIILNGEFFQSQVQSFYENYYYVDYAYSKGDDRTPLLDDIEYVCKKYAVDSFAVKKANDGVGNYAVYVYGNGDVYEELKTKYNIEQKEYKSAISGNTKVEFNDFKEVDARNERFYFIGEDESVSSAVKELFQLQGRTRIKKDAVPIYGYICPLVYIAIFIFMLILNYMDISFQRKEVMIRISLGESVKKIIINNVLKDTLFYCSIFVLLNEVFSQYIFIFYNFKMYILCFLIFIILNGLLYLCLLKYNIRYSLSNNVGSSSLRGNCYVVKIFTMILTMITIATNIVIIKENWDFLRQKKNVESFEKYSFMNINYMESANVMAKEGYYERHMEASQGILYDFYREGKVAWNMLSQIDNEDRKYICVNKNAVSSIECIEEINRIDSSLGVHIFVPEGENIPTEELEKFAVNYSLGDIYSELGNLEYEIIPYKGKKDILYFSQDNSMHSDYIRNPIIIYCTFEDDLFTNSEEIAKEDVINWLISLDDIMFDLSGIELEDLENKYGLSEMGMYLSSNSVIEEYEYYANQLRKALISNMVITILMIILEVVIISTILKLEYMVNAKELALKKVLGYSVFEKNKAIEYLIILSSLVGLSFTVALTLMYKIAIWYLIVLSGIGVLIVEHLVVTYYAIKIEKTSVTKILKGGYL